MKLWQRWTGGLNDEPTTYVTAGFGVQWSCQFAPSARARDHIGRALRRGLSKKNGAVVRKLLGTVGPRALPRSRAHKSVRVGKQQEVNFRPGADEVKLEARSRPALQEQRAVYIDQTWKVRRRSSLLHYWKHPSARNHG